MSEGGKQMSARRRAGLGILAGALVVFGAAEIVTGFRHEFFGVTTSAAVISTFVGMGLGALYLASGILVFTWRKRAATVAVAFLAADVLGRVAMTASGLFPLGSFRQAFAIALGTLIAAGAAVTVALNRKRFR